MSGVRPSIEVLEVVTANFENVFHDPYLGPDWFPIAYTALAVLIDNGTLPLHCCYLGSTCIEYHKGPRLLIQALSDGRILIRVTANEGLSQKLIKSDYEKMEFLGFIPPRTDNGEYALKKGTTSAQYDKHFVRIFEPGSTKEDAITVALNVLSYVYKCKPQHRWHFGSRTELAESARLAAQMETCDHKRPYAPFFFLKGKHPCKVSRLDGSEIMPNGQ